MKFEVGKEYLTRSGKICTVLDTNYNGGILIKYAYSGNSHSCYALDIEGKCSFRKDLDIVGEKPKALHYKEYYVYSASLKDPDQITMCTRLSEIEFNSGYLKEIKKRLLEMGRRFHGVYKVEFLSDGTQEKINF